MTAQASLAPLPGPRFQTKSDSVAAWLRAEILADRLPPGTALLQDEVARQLHISSTPVREAFGTLAAEGFVERRPHRGVIVAQRDPADVADAHRIRNVLEAHAARVVAEQGEPGVLQAIERCLDRADRARRAGDIELFRAANIDFHLAIVDGARSDTLSKIMTSILPRSRMYPPTDAAWMPRLQAEHRRILDAVRRGDGARAADFLHDHNDVRVAKRPRRSDGDTALRTLERLTQAGATP